jgi:pilus assembly protein CpaB
MKPRFVIIVIAVILGLVAVLGVNSYLSNIKKQAVEEQKTVEVWVAVKDIPKGTTIENIQSDKLAELKNIPRRYVASQAISSTRNIEGKVLSVEINAGEQLTVGKFKHPSEAGLSFSVPKDFIAVSIPYDEIKGVAGMVKPGDLLTVFATFSPGPDGEDITKILLQKVQVIAVGATVGAEKTDDKARTVGVA